MTIPRKVLVGGAVALAAALALAGCSTGGGTAKPTAATTTKSVSVNGTEPQNSLIPANTNEVGGGKILDAVFAGLVYYKADGTAENDVAQSISSDDAQHYTVKLKTDRTFTNGEKVTSDSFIKAWQDGAKLSNARLSRYFFEDIEGYSDDADTSLTGLKKVSDSEFTVTLKTKAADFPQRLGYSAFYPLPDSAFDSAGKVTEAFGQNPVGNGPYKFGSKDAWKHNVEISLVTNKAYKGPRKPVNGGLDVKLYASQDAAYQDLIGGNLDVLDQFPASALGTYKQDLGKRWFNTPVAFFQSFTIPSELKKYSNPQAFQHFQGEEGNLRRQAISYAIDRKTISAKIFQGTRTPAKDFSSPTIGGYKAGLEGSSVLDYSPAKAKAAWAKANEISPWSGSFSIAYNSDGGHKVWVDAVCNGLNNVLKGMECTGDAYPTFKEIRAKVTPDAQGKRAIATAFRSGWQADYPGLFNFLGPLYATNASSNDGDYSNPQFDKLLRAGSVADSPDAASEQYQKAEEVLFKDLPAIPLWYQNATGGWGEGVSNVKVGWNSVPIYYQIEKK